MNQSTQTEPTIKPRDTFVEMYNELWLNIREQKNTLSQWISNVFDKVSILKEEVDTLEERVNDNQDDLQILEDRIEAMKEELRDELMREVREEMRS